jgi:hypothetical protein
MVGVIGIAIFEVANGWATCLAFAILSGHVDIPKKRNSSRKAALLAILLDFKVDTH